MPQTQKTTANSLMDDFAHFKVCQPDDSESPSQREDDFPTPPAFRLGIVGVGQCGNNMAAMFHEIGYRKVLRSIRQSPTSNPSVNPLKNY
jgi:hypothetical protein